VGLCLNTTTSGDIAKFDRFYAVEYTEHAYNLESISQGPSTSGGTNTGTDTLVSSDTGSSVTGAPNTLEQGTSIDVITAEGSEQGTNTGTSSLVVIDSGAGAGINTGASILADSDTGSQAITNHNNVVIDILSITADEGIDSGINTGTMILLSFDATANTTASVVSPYASLDITIDDVAVIVLNATLSLDEATEERSTATFTIFDPDGTTRYQKGQKLKIIHSIRGLIFAGIINDATEKTYAANPSNSVTVRCVDNVWYADKLLVRKQDTPNRFAGDVFTDLLSQLAAEGITANYANRTDSTQADFAEGTLSNVVATASGDLELAPAGTDLSVVQQVGTATPVWGIKAQGYAAAGYSNAFYYKKVWAGNITVATGDALSFDVWISSDSPEIKASIDIQFSDGSRLKDSTDIKQDAQSIGVNGNNDLGGFANDQWYSRSFTVGSTLVGKHVVAVLVGFEGERSGTYTAYFKNVQWNRGGSLNTTFFGASTTKLQSNVFIGTNGYSNVSIKPTLVYPNKTNTFQFTHGLGGVGIIRGSWIYLNQDSSTIGQDASITVQSSQDNATSWQDVTSGAAIPLLRPGMKTSGLSLLIRALVVLGRYPDVLPKITSYGLNVYSSYAATKSDVRSLFDTASDFNTGTVAGAVQVTTPTGSNGRLTMNGLAINFDAVGTGPTWYGAGAFPVTLRRTLGMSNNGAGDSRIRFDQAGQWHDFTAEADVQTTADDTTNVGMVFRTTSWVNTNDTYAYVVYLSGPNATTGLCNFVLGKGSNSTSASFTTLVSTTIAAEAQSWHHLKVNCAGTLITVSLDDVQMLQTTDSSYNITGYIGLRYYNNAGTGGGTGYFNNFGVISSYSGTWTSPNIPLASLSGYGGSSIEWFDGLIPDTTDALVEVSLNGGTTWTACTNGADIPGLASPLPANIKIRVTLSTVSASVQPALGGISLYILGGYSASGTRTSLALDITNVGRVGSSAFTWQTVEPTGASVGMDLSPNGTSWTDVTATPNSPVPFLTAQPEPLDDSFDENTSASYGTPPPAGSTIVAAPTALYAGLNYYHESMGYISRTNTQIAADLAAIAVVTKRLKVYFNPLPQDAGGVSRASSIAKVQAIVQAAKNLGFYVVWTTNIDQGQVLTDSTTNLSNPASYKWKWADYAAQVTADAALAEAAGADEYLVGNEIIGSGHYYNTDPGTSVATAIYTSVFPGYVSTLVDNCRAHFSGKIGLQELGTITAMWAPSGVVNLRSLDLIYYDVYEKWSNFQDKVSSLTALFGSKMVLGEISASDVLGHLSHYSSYTEADYTTELLRRYDYCRQQNTPFYAFTYGDPATSSDGFGLRLFGAGYHDVWDYLAGQKNLYYTPYFHDVFPPNDFTGGNGGTGGGLDVDSSHASALASVGPTDYVYRGRVKWYTGTGSFRIVTRYTDANNYYALDVNITSSQVKTIRRQGGTETTLGTAATWPPFGVVGGVPLASQTFTQFDFEMRVNGTGAGTRIETFFDQYKLCDLTDTGNTSLNTPTFGLLYVDMTATLMDVRAHSLELTGGIDQSNGLWQWESDESRLTVIGGLGASLLYTGLTATTALPDVEILFDTDQADGAGPIWRYSDANNFYHLLIYDDSGIQQQNTVQVYEVHSGVRNLLTAAQISFARGTTRRFVVSMVGSAITISFDGQVISTLSDATPLPAGTYGVYSGYPGTAGTTHILQLRAQFLGQDVSGGATLYSRQRLASTDPTVTPQVTGLSLSVHNPSIGLGPLLPSTDYYKKKYVSGAFSDLATQANYWWTINHDSSAIFQERIGQPSTWIANAANGDILLDGAQMTNGADTYRNVEVVTNCTDTATFSEVKQGDNVSTSWALSYKVAATPTVYLNGQKVTVGVKGTDTGRTIYYAIGDNTISLDSSLGPLTKDQQLAIAGLGQFTTDVERRNLAAIAEWGRREKGSGIVEHFTDGQGMSVEAGALLAQSLLDKNCVLGRTASFKTRKAGLRPGQILPIYIASFGLKDDLMLIHRVRTTFRLAFFDGAIQTDAVYTIEASEGPQIGDWIQLFRKRK
jgi:hypothetical protein